jgi:peptidoglycan/xylan/chitin deacetylase (PgdA/CDA1 family)
MENLLALSGAAAAATLLAGSASAWLGYAAIAPRSQVFGETFVRSPNPKQLALTYDDGPNDPHTLRLLDVLARHDVHATFFLIGKFVRQRPEIVRRISAAGHAIGNHTFTHPNLIFAGAARIAAELQDCENALSDIVPEHARIFRPPFGFRRPQVLRSARAQGLVPVMWSVTCYDWKQTTAERIVAHAVRQIHGGDVILLHDGGYREMGADRGATIVATELLIARYRDQGFEFVTLPKMMVAPPIS